MHQFMEVMGWAWCAQLVIKFFCDLYDIKKKATQNQTQISASSLSELNRE